MRMGTGLEAGSRPRPSARSRPRTGFLSNAKQAVMTKRMLQRLCKKMKNHKKRLPRRRKTLSSFKQLQTLSKRNSLCSASR
ncbi:hypothetical protein Hdeb2414_s0008g00294781 [Helianthus debilis subsp. tardiflorus]